MIVEWQKRILEYIEQNHAAQVRFLAELVKVPSDNPPGDCASHAVRAAELLEQLGFRSNAIRFRPKWCARME